MVGLHATDPASVYLAAYARIRDVTVAEIERVLYEERRALRMLGMRRTMFVVPLDLAAVLQAACTNTIAATQRRRYARMLEEAGIARDGLAWLDDVMKEAFAALERRGQAYARDLSEDVPRLREKIAYGEGKKWGGTFTVTTWALFLLAADGKIVRGRPRGSWTSSQHIWIPATSWFDEPLRELDQSAARVDLVRRWLATFGPGTVDDLKWWTGLTLGQVRAALAEIAPLEVDLDGATGLVLAGDDEPEQAPEPWAALLPALDPTVMGWKERSWYLGDHRASLFDTAGNAGPTVWWDGRIVGGWGVRASGEVVFRLLEDVGSDAIAAVDAEAERLTAWIGQTRVIPRFATPLARDLVR